MMGKNNFNIPQKKYSKALQLLLEGKQSYSSIAQQVGISRNTLQRIREDEDTQQYIREQTDHNIRNAVGKAGDTAIDLLGAKSELVRLQAAQFVLALNGIQVTDKSEVHATVKSDKLDSILSQLSEDDD